MLVGATGDMIQQDSGSVVAQVKPGLHYRRGDRSPEEAPGLHRISMITLEEASGPDNWASVVGHGAEGIYICWWKEWQLPITGYHTADRTLRVL